MGTTRLIPPGGDGFVVPPGGEGYVTIIIYDNNQCNCLIITSSDGACVISDDTCPDRIDGGVIIGQHFTETADISHL